MKFRTKIVSLVLVVLSLFCLTGCEYLYEGGTVGPGTNVDISGSRTKYTDSLKLALLPSASSSFDVDGMCFATVDKYVDGDTTYFYAKLSTGKDSISIRYMGLDTPESTYKVEPWGIAAAKFTKDKLSVDKQSLIESKLNEIVKK